MTTTPPPQQPPPSSAAQQAAEAALVTAVALALINGLTAAGVAGGLATAYAPLKIRSMAMRAALGIVMGHPPGQDGFWGEAGRQMARQNTLRRAQFTVASAQRINADITRAQSTGQNMKQALFLATQRESRFYGQHLVATWNRQRAASQVDSAALAHGRLLGWHTVLDSRTSLECRQANGKNFFADHVPVIGYPGAVHPHCRCQPGAPFRTGAILPSYGLNLGRAA